MLERNFQNLFQAFRANYYRHILEKLDGKSNNLSAVEILCVEIIYLMKQPTIGAFAQFLDISVPNANYKINSLVDKGYVVRQQAPDDKRKVYLSVTENFLDSYGSKNKDNAQLLTRIEETFSAEEQEQLCTIIQKILCLMPPQPEELQ